MCPNFQSIFPLGQHAGLGAPGNYLAWLFFGGYQRGLVQLMQTTTSSVIVIHFYRS